MSSTRFSCRTDGSDNGKGSCPAGFLGSCLFNLMRGQVLGAVSARPGSCSPSQGPGFHLRRDPGSSGFCLPDSLEPFPSHRIGMVALSLCLSMIFSENRIPLFGIMLEPAKLWLAARRNCTVVAANHRVFATPPRYACQNGFRRTGAGVWEAVPADRGPVGPSQDPGLSAKPVDPQQLRVRLQAMRAPR